LKTWEIRINDRDFQVGDSLCLLETHHTGEQMAAGSPLIFTGRMIDVDVVYILPGPTYGLSDEWVIMSWVEVMRANG